VIPVIDEALVRALLHEQHPDLADLRLQPVEGGWDAQLWRLGDQLAVRLPRSSRAPALLQKEYRWVPGLAARLPLPVPVPVRAGQPSARFPRFWTIVAWVPGQPADLAPISQGPRSAARLAGFLTALHQEAPSDAPANPDRGVPLETVPRPDARGLAELAPPGRADDLARIWADALAAPAWPGPPVWIHGDLHPANVVTQAGTLSGVVDFGELAAGDPAADLAAAWLLLPAGCAHAFLDRYFGGTRTETSRALITRARGWAIRSASGLIQIGQAGLKGRPGGKPTWLPAGRAAIDRVLTSEVP
jgi:aminoglycoside phosphotransferase (APT) family kinase protein